MNHVLKNLIFEHIGKTREDLKLNYKNWCGEFLQNVLYPLAINDYTKKNLSQKGLISAKKWMHIGQKVIDKNNAQPGDIVVLHRKKSDDWRGHVGLFVRHKSDDEIMLFGGNQSGTVSISNFKSEKIAGIRRIL